MTPSENWSQLHSSPATLAPAFVILLGGCAAIFSDFAGTAPSISVLIAASTAAAWVLTGSERLVPRLAQVFILIMAMTISFATITVYRLNKHVESPAHFSTTAKVLLNREWGVNRALLLSSPYGRMAAYLPPAQAPPAGATVRIRGAVFDFNSADRDDFDESLFWKAKGAVKKFVLLECHVIAEPRGIHLW